MKSQKMSSQELQKQTEEGSEIELEELDDEEAQKDFYDSIASIKDRVLIIPGVGEFPTNKITKNYIHYISNMGLMVSDDDMQLKKQINQKTILGLIQKPFQEEFRAAFLRRTGELYEEMEEWLENGEEGEPPLSIEDLSAAITSTIREYVQREADNFPKD